ncbi:TPA: sel1 repeat family protein [Klebsiella oxytoca]|uniref:Sel1 repeat family protein n=1 Tax=Klebsiella oxytoca TaxID=571 RepID=A0AAN5L9P3_KLEOX|nr:sel1 repeat family protein [Klebsiella oxytoca]
MGVGKFLLWSLLVTGLLSACSSPPPLTGKALETAAAQGNAHAQYVLARQLSSRREYSSAMRLMQKVGNSGKLSSATPEERRDAAYQAGEWYQAGLGEPRNRAMAMMWWKKASLLGSAPASYRLAQICQQEHGEVLTIDCVDVLETAAKQGSSGAQLMLTRWFASKPGTEQQALSWLEKAAAQSDPEALYLLAQRYEKGEGVDKREDRARRLYRQSAEKGYPGAQRWQGEHSEGMEAFRWYQKAAQGHDVLSERWLADAYASGGVVPHNDQQSLIWLTRAAEAGDPEAQFLCSQRQGSDEMRDHYLRLAAEGGNRKAQRALAGIYTARGEEVLARKMWAELAGKGDPQSRYAYAEMLRTGQGGKVEFAQAYRQYRLAAMEGDAQAQYRTGMMRQEGYGVTRNRVHAYAWYALATARGLTDARTALNDLEATMGAEEIKAAQKLALQWENHIAAARTQVSAGGQTAD